MPAEKHLEAYKLLDELPNKAFAVLLNRPAHSLADLLSRKGVDVQRLCFADHVTNHIGSSLEQINTVYGEGRFTISKADALLRELVEKTNKEKKLVFFDALHDLYQYYDEATILQFLEYFIDRARILHLHPVFLFERRKITSRVMRRLQHLCDEVIRIK